jgi:hypothetical protein
MPEALTISATETPLNPCFKNNGLALAIIWSAIFSPEEPLSFFGLPGLRGAFSNWA